MNVKQTVNELLANLRAVYENKLLPALQSAYENAKLFFIKNNPMEFLYSVSSSVYENKIALYSITFIILFILCALISRRAAKSKVKRTSTMYKEYVRIKKNYVLKDTKRRNLFIYEISHTLLLRNLNIDEFIYSKLANKNSNLWECFEDMLLNHYMNSRTNARIRNLPPTDARIIKRKRMSVKRFHSIERKLCRELPNPNEDNIFEFVLYAKNPKRMKKAFKLTFNDLLEVEDAYETEATKHFLEKRYNKWLDEMANKKESSL